MVGDPLNPPVVGGRRLRAHFVRIFKLRFSVEILRSVATTQLFMMRWDIFSQMLADILVKIQTNLM